MMTEQFVQSFRACLEELVRPLRYLHKPSGNMIAPQIIDVMLPRPNTQTQEGDEYPFVRWMITSGEWYLQKPSTFQLAIDAGIYSAGSISDGNLAILELVHALGSLSRMRFVPPTPYRLQTPIAFVLGDPKPENHGIQPHPYYYGRLTLDFIHAGPSSAPCKQEKP